MQASPWERESQTPDPYESPEPTLSVSETIAITRNVVEAARREQESLNGDENVGEAVKLSLTVDMGRKGIESLPEEVVHILKRDVERYAKKQGVEDVARERRRR